MFVHGVHVAWFYTLSDELWYYGWCMKGWFAVSPSIKVMIVHMNAELQMKSGIIIAKTHSQFYVRPLTMQYNRPLSTLILGQTWCELKACGGMEMSGYTYNTAAVIAIVLKYCFPLYIAMVT